MSLPAEHPAEAPPRTATSAMLDDLAERQAQLRAIIEALEDKGRAMETLARAMSADFDRAAALGLSPARVRELLLIRRRIAAEERRP
jgi:hypothetical protein